MKGLRFVILGSALLIAGVLGIMCFGIENGAVYRMVYVFFRNYEISSLSSILTKLFALLSGVNIIGGFTLAVVGLLKKD